MRASGSLDQEPGPGYLTFGTLFSIQTDAKGRYRVLLDAGRVGKYRPSWVWTPDAIATWDVYLTSPGHVGYASLSLTIRKGQASARQDIRLQRGDQVHGTVAAAGDGRPLRGATVYAMLTSRVMQPPVLAQARTDRRGRFSIPMDLPSGAYRVGVQASGWAMLARARPRTAAQGRGSALALSMVPRSFPVSAQVLDSQAVPLKNRRVQLVERAVGVSDDYPGYEGSHPPLATDARGRITYTYEWQPEEHFPWVIAYPELLLRVKYRELESNVVHVDAAHRDEAPAVFRLR